MITRILKKLQFFSFFGKSFTINFGRLVNGCRRKDKATIRQSLSEENSALEQKLTVNRKIRNQH